jgi:hypothetical protein
MVGDQSRFGNGMNDAATRADSGNSLIRADDR